MKKSKKVKIRKLLAFMLALALMVSCVPSAYTISASEAFGDGTEDIFTDGESVSEPAAEESTTDVGSADQEEQAQQTTLTYEDDSIKVTAEALDEGALPQNTTLKADAVNENSSVSYDTVSQKLTKAAEDKGSILRGFSAYDVYFADADGNRAELNGKARITIEYKNPMVPELSDAENTSVTAVKFHYNGSTGETEISTLQPNEELKVLNVNENKGLQTVQVETANAAVFAVMWDSPEANVAEAEVKTEETEATPAPEQETEPAETSAEEPEVTETPAEEPEVTETPVEEPEVTGTPVEEPEVTEAPAEEPEVTEAPAEEPEVTETPAEEPEVTETPAEEPEVTETPAEEPEVTETPAEEPEVTETPVEEPEVTEIPAEEPEITETPAMMIEVIADDVNIRVSPSTEAESLMKVEVGMQFTVLETVTAEDGTTWYKVSCEGTEGYIRSDLVKVVEDVNESEKGENSSEEIQEEEAVTYTKEVDNVVITATAAQGVLPEDAELVVNAIDKDNSQYSEVADKLEEKAKEEEYSIAGFLAYDIFFTDKDGNKIEPQDGKVKVSMEYVQAVIPEEVTKQENAEEAANDVNEEDVVSDGVDSSFNTFSDNTKNNVQKYEIALMHLSEDANGQVKEVVDMTGEGQGNVETTNSNEVTKAEFETESFSAFTIIWKVNNVNYTLNVHRMLENADGNLEEIDSSNINYETTYNNANSVNLAKLADSYGVTDYIYSYGYVETTSKEKKTATKISYNNYGQGQSGENWWYEKDSTDKWEIYATGKTSDVYLVYKKTYLNTVDSKKDGITVNLFEYNDTNVNSGHALQFVRLSGNGINAWTGGAKPNQGIMKNLLGLDRDGNYTYPVLSGNNEGTSYLFSPTDTTAKTNYTDLNKLFTKDADGYYEYNSALNYAYLDGSDFKVYSIPGTTTEAQGTSGGKNVGGFFPFNPLPGDSDELISGIRNIETGTDNKTRVDHFGMTMSAEFIQPEDGKVNGKDMEFTFSGDDDVWVYIDGVLVLDIGGIHDAVSGTINFATGEVTVTSKDATNLRALFEAAGASTDAFVKGKNTFADYTGHTINFYYLERGSFASNCHLKFNLSTVPESSVAVEKQLSNTDKEKYANVEFKFQVLAQEILSTDSISGKETYGDTYVPLGSNAVLNDEDSTPVTFSKETIDGKEYDNVFTLKPGQRAIFKGLKKARKYMVKEIGVKTNEYDHIYINRTEITVTDKDGNQISGETAVGNITSGEATVGNRPLVIFTNNCSSANSRELQITKKIKNDIAVTDKFNFKVQLNGLDYTGDYYLKDSKGNYYIQNEDGTPVSKGSTSAVCGTAKNGVISSVPAGYTVAITQILSGTKFTVEEVNLNTREYNSPEYKVESADNIKTNPAAEGTIKLGNDAKVTVTNTLSNVTELVIKKVNSNGAILPGAEFTLTSKDDTTKTYQATADKDGLVKFGNLFSGTYTLTETKVPSGYENRNTWIVKVEKNEDGSVVAKLYEADGTTEIQKDETDGYYHIVNYTHQELIESDIEYSKTAHVTDWENREYQIDISAASKSVSTTTETRSSDVVLVLDVSGSMDESMSYTYVGTNTAETRSTLDTSRTTYYLKSGNNYYQMTYSGNAWRITSGNRTYSLNSYYNGYEIYSKLTRLDALKDSVEAFITSLAQKSPNSRVGITAFSSNYYADTINGKTQNMLTVGANKDTLISFVKSLTAKGGTVFAGNNGTYGRTGLYRAKDLLDGIKNNSSNNVILFTDGAPTGDNTGTNPAWDSNVVSTANQAAKNLKDAGYNVYTIGFALTAQANAFLAGGTYGSTTYPGIASSAECAKTADDAESLSEIFRTIEQTITNDIDITNATITDTIDPRFDLIGDDGKIITETSLGPDGTLTLANGGVVRLVDGKWQVQWTKVTIPNKNKKEAWSRSIKVKAKDTYIGGNDVTTNVAEGSNIKFGDEKVDLPQPKVNVNVKIFINDKEVTIYKGDIVPTEEAILKQLFDESDTTSYANGKVGAGDYSNLELHWYTNPEYTDEVTVEQMATQPDADTHYYLKVTYNAGEPSGESNSNTTLDGKTYIAGGDDRIQEATNPNNNNNPYGIYTIHVISGEIDIIKKVSETSSDPREFQFNVKKVSEDGNEVDVDGSPFTVTVPANADAGTLSDEAKAKLSKLPRGTYTVTEIVPSGYKITETDTDGTNCEVSSADNVMTFILGNGINTKSNVISANYTYNSANGGVLGKATYTNEYSADLDLKKISSNDNSALSGAKFKLEVKENSTWKSAGGAYDSFEVNNNDNAVELRNLKPGLYKLTEIEAPKGYTLLSESIYFQVSRGNIMLTDKDGKLFGNQSMWTLTGRVLTIKNTKMYTLPSAGGPGIYGFTISGVAILATALLLFINNKRREEEAERS